MTKKQLVSRWRVMKMRLEKEGVGVELDMLSARGIVIRIKTSRESISELIEWGYQQWDDVKSCWQSQDDRSRTFGVTFRVPKDYEPGGEPEIEHEEEGD